MVYHGDWLFEAEVRVENVACCGGVVVEPAVMVPVSWMFFFKKQAVYVK